MSGNMSFISRSISRRTRRRCINRHRTPPRPPSSSPDVFDTRRIPPTLQRKKKTTRKTRAPMGKPFLALVSSLFVLFSRHFEGETRSQTAKPNIVRYDVFYLEPSRVIYRAIYAPSPVDSQINVNPDCFFPLAPAEYSRLARKKRPHRDSVCRTCEKSPAAHPHGNTYSRSRR